MNGVLLVHKEMGMTSFDVVHKLRKILHIKQIGHTGTLDPNATGILVILVGKATKTLPYLMNQKKEYIATLKLGSKTSTGDIWGEEIESKPVKEYTKEEVDAVLQSFLGKQQQIPPMVSAVKIDGKKLYEYAREGKTIERKSREIEIYEIELLSINPIIQFRVICSSGTFIRVLCEDIAEKLHTVGTMESLVRSKIDHFTLKDCKKLNEIREDEVLLPIYEVLKPYPYIRYEPIKDVYDGKRIFLDTNEDLVMIIKDIEVVACYKREEGKKFKCVRGLW